KHVFAVRAVQGGGWIERESIVRQRPGISVLAANNSGPTRGGHLPQIAAPPRSNAALVSPRDANYSPRGSMAGEKLLGTATNAAGEEFGLKFWRTVAIRTSAGP